MPSTKRNSPNSSDRLNSENRQRGLVDDHIGCDSSNSKDGGFIRKELETNDRPYFGIQEPEFSEGGGFGRHHDHWYGETQPGSLAEVAGYDFSRNPTAFGHIPFCGRGGYRGSHAGYQGDD